MAWGRNRSFLTPRQGLQEAGTISNSGQRIGQGGQVVVTARPSGWPKPGGTPETVCVDAYLVWPHGHATVEQLRTHGGT